MIYKKGVVWKVKGNPARFNSLAEAEAFEATCIDCSSTPCECEEEQEEQDVELSPLEKMRATWKSADET